MTNFKRFAASVLLATAIAPSPASAWFYPFIQAINGLENSSQAQAGVQGFGKTAGSLMNSIFGGTADAGVNANANADTNFGATIGANVEGTISIGTSASDCSSNQFFYECKSVCIETGTDSNSQPP
jgi:hypothetical protein